MPRAQAADLGDRTPRVWFREAIRATVARLAPIGTRIALEAAEVAPVYARKDPGDGLRIALARIRRVPIITRGAEMIAPSGAGEIPGRV